MKESSFFPPERSAARKFGNDSAAILAAVADRYVKANPPAVPVFRAYNEGVGKRDWDGRYRFSFPGAEAGIALSTLNRADAGTLPLAMSGSGPVELYVNGEKAAETDGPRRNVEAKLNAGENALLLVFRRAPGAQGSAVPGGEFGVVSPYRELRFLMPSRERRGQEGWLRTAAVGDAAPADFFRAPDFSESDDAVRWLPERAWSEEETRRGKFGRIFGFRPEAVAGARANLLVPGKLRVSFDLAHSGDAALFVDGVLVGSGSGSGTIRAETVLDPGAHDLRILSACPGTERDRGSWDFDLAAKSGSDALELGPPLPIAGYGGVWAFLGPFAADRLSDAAVLDRFYSPADALDGPAYWRLDGAGLALRPYFETPLFAQWNYPLGVTLYGLLAAGRVLRRKDLTGYVLSHVSLATSLHDLSRWDYGTYGATAINRQLAGIDLLDNCGSFGSLMLEASAEGEIPNLRTIADRIAKFVTADHERLPGGAFYRARHHVPSVVGTLWADDLYMSVPFLLRYYRLTGNASILDDAVLQIEQFARLLYRPELDILHHVYDVKRGEPNGVSWGRGNGWFFFSLAEMLTVLPEKHPARDRLLGLFSRTAKGYAALQDGDGRWHQVLTDPTSFPETSCTAMFAYGFARGFSRGWLPAAYAHAAERAWAGIAEHAIDEAGNVYGVCQGSGFSFDPDYYRRELTWILNDTHGTGIVLLAGTEVLGMEKRQ